MVQNIAGGTPARRLEWGQALDTEFLGRKGAHLSARGGVLASRGGIAMALERYVKLSAAAKLCGMDRRTLLLRLKEKGFVLPVNSGKRPLMVRESDIRDLMDDCTVLPQGNVSTALHGKAHVQKSGKP